MFIAKNNILKGTSPSVIVGTGSDLSSNMTSSDFSLNYTASGNVITIQLTNLSNISYIALSGLNFAGATVRITNSVDFSQTVIPARNNCVMFNFQERSFSSIRVQVVSASGLPTISHLAAGKAILVPNGGEASGYSRQWLNRSASIRTTSNGIAAPVSSLIKREPLKVNLSLPDMTTEFARTEWQEFSDFAASGEVFYISEQPDYATQLQEASYACYSPSFSAPKAHSATRALQNLSIGFNCYNGL